MAPMNDADFDAYKRRLIPVLYDWFMHYHLGYPTQTCRWGPKVEDLGYKTKFSAYLSEQVWDESTPNTLILAHIDVLKPHVASSEAVSNWQERSKAPHVQIVKTIYHPGEVNKVREVPQQPQVVVTHTDSDRLYVWNMDRQPDRRPHPQGLAAAEAAEAEAAVPKGRGGRDKGKKKNKGKNKDRDEDEDEGGSSPGPAEASVPDLVLVGHEDDAPFPLACAAAAPRVGSGGNDTLVLVWDLGDHMSALTAPSAAAAASSSGKPSELKPRIRLEGHTDAVCDLVFQPGGCEQLISVADDGRILTWDLRAGGRGRGSCCVAKVEDAHGAGINVLCVDWCPLDDNMLVTGAHDGSLQVWDRRRMASRTDRLFHFDHRSGGSNSASSSSSPSQEQIIHVEWHPTCKDVFASGSEDHTIAIWDLSRTQMDADSKAATAAAAAAAGGEPGGSGGEAGGGGGAGDAGDKEKEKGAPARKRPRGSGAKDGAGSGGGKGAAEEEARAVEAAPQLIFQHLGHRLGRVTDFQWLPTEPWTLISVSDNDSNNVDVLPDGTLQVWRINDLIYRPYEEAVAELEQHREFIMRGSTAVTPSTSPAGKDGSAKAVKPEVKQEAAAP